MKADPIRLAWLFREAGMIDGAAYDQCVQDYSPKSKTIMDILKTEVTIKGIRDLLTKDIELPFGKKDGDSRAEDGSLHSALSQPLYLSQAEAKSILSHWKPSVADFAGILSKAGVVEESPQAIVESLGKSQGIYGRLAERGLLESQILNQAVNSADFPAKRMNRLLLALNLMKHNGVLEEEDCEEILKNVQAKGTERIPQLNGEISAFIGSEPDLPEVNLNEWALAENLRRCLPVSVIRQSLLVPLRRGKGMLELAMSDPFDFALLDTLSLLTGASVVGFHASTSLLIRKIQEAFNDGESAEKAAASNGKSAGVVITSASIPPAQSNPISVAISIPADPHSDSEDGIDSQSAVELVSSIIEGGVRSRATDIHLEPQNGQLRVRYRIDGKLRNIMQVPAKLILSVISRIKVLSNLDVTERRRPQDGHFSLSLSQNAFDFRISTLPTHTGEKIVIRILDASRVSYNLESLGMEESLSKVVCKWIARPHGLVLVTGPTGCGKTSTLYAALNIINSESRNIVTIEDPVEYQLDGINQVQVDPNIEMGFATGLRAILRQDPDVIMVGEIRDQETARIAVRAALTGHLVFSTLHTNTAAGAIATLRQMGIEPYMLVSAVSGVISQRLVRMLCPECRESFVPNKEMLMNLKMDPKSRKRLYRAKGCDACFNTGYRGRTGIFEILPVNESMAAAILDNKSEAELVAIAREQGLKSIFDNAISKLSSGITSPEEVMETLIAEE